MSTEITRDDWMRALSEAGINDGEDDQSALTVAEFTALIGCSSRQAAVRRLNVLEVAGKAKRTTKRSRTTDGKVIMMSAWRLYGV